MLVEILRNSPSDGNPIIGGSPPPDFIQQDKAPLRDVIEDIGGLIHLYHESRFSSRNIIRSAYPSEYFIQNPKLGMFSRNKTPYLREKTDDGRLPKNSRFTGHVWPRYHDNLLSLSVKENIIRDVFFSQRKRLLYHGMSSFFDVYAETII